MNLYRSEEEKLVSEKISTGQLGRGQLGMTIKICHWQCVIVLLRDLEHITGFQFPLS